MGAEFEQLVGTLCRDGFLVVWPSRVGCFAHRGHLAKMLSRDNKPPTDLQCREPSGFPPQGERRGQFLKGG
jgi:hypothetical protein